KVREQSQNTGPEALRPKTSETAHGNLQSRLEMLANADGAATLTEPDEDPLDEPLFDLGGQENSDGRDRKRKRRKLNRERAS
ncbi:MAG: hypothetical protein AAFV62_09480, partial [Pseudomonadota bacterium]